MAKTILKAGAELEFLSPEEYQKGIDKMMDRYRQITLEQEGETITVAATPFKTNSSSVGTGNVWRVPAGFDAFLTRLVVDYPTSSAKTGGHKCDVRVAADAVAPPTTKATYNFLPWTYEASKSHAPLFRAGQMIVVRVTGTAGPTTTTIFASIQVVLTRRHALSADTLNAQP